MTIDHEDLNLDALEATARAATPGPWATGEVTTWGDDDEIPQAAVLVSGSPLTWDDHGGEVFDPVNAEHIATFDPPTALALIARLREAEQGVTELTKDEEVTVEGSIFRWSELPEVLARNMRAVTEARQEAKRWAIRSEESTARLRGAEACIDGALDVIRDRDGDPDGRIERILRAENVLSRYKTTKTEGES